MLKSEAHKLKRVVVSTPLKEYFNIENLKAHNILEVADRGIAIKQHNHLKKIIELFGAEVIDEPELIGHPNSVFTRDSAICTPEGYIELVPGIETRQAEGRWMASALDNVREPKVGGIQYPGTVDGGDVVLLDQVVFIGLSKRTNTEGSRQLAQYLDKMGYEIRQIELPDSVLHLDKVLMPVYPDRLLVCSNIVPQDALNGFETTRIDFNESSSANIICLGNGELIVSDANQGAIDVLDQGELKLHLLDISEFIKGSGGPNCLIMPVEREF